MRAGRAYKLAAVAASHKANAILLLEDGNHAEATKEEIAFIDCIEDIPSWLRQKVMPFVDDCVAAKIAVRTGSTAPR